VIRSEFSAIAIYEIRRLVATIHDARPGAGCDVDSVSGHLAPEIWMDGLSALPF